MKFEAENKKIEEILFSSNLSYKIPAYQRPYTWNTEHLEDFLE